MHTRISFKVTDRTWIACRKHLLDFSPMHDIFLEIAQPRPPPAPSKNNGRPSSVSVATLLDFEAYRMRNGSHSLSYIFYYLARVYVYFYGISPTSTFPNVRKPHQTNGLFLQGSISPPSTWVRGVTVETGAKTAVTSSAT